MKIVKWGMFVIIILFLGWLGTKTILNKKNVLSPIDNRDHIIVKDKFSVLLPKDWQEIEPVANGIVFSAQNLRNLKSNYHITYDMVKDSYKNDYLTYIKQSIIKTSPQVQFLFENKNEIEAELLQDKVVYKSLIKVFWGENNEVYLLSFNSLQSDWETNKLIFDKVVNSFEIKK